MRFELVQLDAPLSALQNVLAVTETQSEPVELPAFASDPELASVASPDSASALASDPDDPLTVASASDPDALPALAPAELPAVSPDSELPALASDELPEVDPSPGHVSISGMGRTALAPASPDAGGSRKTSYP